MPGFEIDNLFMTKGAKPRTNSFSIVFNNDIDSGTSRSETFHLLMTKALKNKSAAAEKTGGLAQNNKPSKNRTALEELQSQLDALGLPLNLLTLDPADFSGLRKILENDGLDQKQIEEFMNRLGDKPLGMDRVMADLGFTVKKNGLKLILPETAKSQLGRFLQEMGFKSDQVKNILSDLEQRQAITVQALKEALLAHGDSNLKDINLSGADPDNLKDLLTAMGVSARGIQKFRQIINQTSNKMSAQDFFDFLGSLEQSKSLNPDQTEEIKSFIQNLKLDNTFRIEPYFNRIVCLLSCIGDDQVNQDFIDNNPALEALRTGAVPGQVQNAGADLQATVEVQGSNEASRASAPIFQQVADKMLYSVRFNKHHAQIQLEPKELGSIRINLVYEDNIIRANIIAENGFVKESLDQHVTQLKNILAQHNLNLDKFEVSLGVDQNNFSDRPQTWGQDQKGGSAGDSEHEEENAPAMSIGALAPPPGVRTGGYLVNTVA